VDRPTIATAARDPKLPSTARNKAHFHPAVEAEIRRRLAEHLSENQALIDRAVVRFASPDMMIGTEEMERKDTQGLIRAVQRLDINLSWAERYPWYLRQIRREPTFT
jgi:hypothetical protein